MASFVDSREKAADGDVVGYFNFHARQLACGVVNPRIPAHLGKDCGGAGCGFVGGIGLHAVFREHAVTAWLAVDKGVEERGTRGVDQLPAIFLFLCSFVIGFALRVSVLGSPGERALKFLEFGAIQVGIGGFAVRAHRDVIDAGSCRHGARDLDFRLGSCWTLPDLFALNAFVNRLRFVILSLIGNYVLEHCLLLVLALQVG